MCRPFAQSNCENKSFEPDHQIPSQCLIRRFLTVITIFLGALSQKWDDFSWIINQVLRIFWFQAFRKPHFENKGNFWINCVCIKEFVSWYTHKWAFAFITYLQEDIHVMAYPYKGIFASWHPYKKHSHHGMPIRRHLHHKTFCIYISTRRHLHHD